MRTHVSSLAFAFALTLTSLSGRAHAEADEDGAEPLPVLDSDSIAAERPVTVCVPGDHAGVSDTSAKTAFGVVCDALRRAGAPVVGISQAPAKGDSAYRMDLQRLEHVILLRITHESPVGSPRDSRTLTLNGLDEILVGADRVSVALVQGKSVEDTAKVDTLVGTETRNYQKKKGETFFGAGISGLAVPAVGVYTGAGLEFAGFYETPSFAVGGALRFSVSGGSDDNRASFGSFSFGGRGFLTESDVSPYLGGGFGLGWIALEKGGSDGHFNGSAEGFGAYGEVGVEMLRLHRTRFLVGVRVDVPFYSAKATEYSYAKSSSGGGSSSEVTTRQYAIPITLNITFLPFKL